MTGDGRFGSTAGAEHLGRGAVIGLMLVPLLIGVVLAWALAVPASDLNRVTAAIVNADEPVTIDGQTVPLGRELAAGLIAGGEPGTGGADAGAEASATFTWILTNSADAAAGLAAGSYVAVVTIPPSFSADATSISGPGAQARQAVIDVATTPNSAWLDPALTGAVSEAAAGALGRQITARYLAQVYDGFNTIGEQIGEASTGAHQLASGAASTASGAGELAAGAGDLAAGATALDTGARDLAQGVSRLDAAIQPLPGGTAELARGANEVARALGETTRQVEETTAAAAAVVHEVCRRTGPACDRARAALVRLEGVDERLRALDSGARRVAVGNDALAVLMPDIVGGVDAAAAGASEVAAGAQTVTAGASSVAQGAGVLSQGTREVDQGAAQLAAGLDQATAQLPSYSDDDIATLSTVVAQPVVTTQERAPAGVQSVPLFSVFALWFGGAVAASVVPSVPTRRLLTGTRSLSISAAAVVPTGLIGGGQGLVVALAVVGSVAGATPVSGLAFVLACVLVGGVFAIANQGLAAAFGAAGRIVAVAIGFVALAAGLTSTVPPSIASVGGALPTAAATALVRAPFTGGDVVAAMIGLVLTVAGGFVLVFAGVARQRRVRLAVQP